MSAPELDLIEPKANGLSYESYLKVRELTSLQHPLSPTAEHDETLFIIIHQVYELWFKQILHEIDRARQTLQQDDLMATLRTLQRIATIQETLTKQVDILETMTPNDFGRFRSILNPASGFQSFQFRLVEFKLGEKNPNYLKFHKHQPEHYLALENALAQPTLYDEVLRAMARQQFAIPDVILQRDLSQNYVATPEATIAFASIYDNPSQHYDWYMLAEALADVDEHFLLWRFRHVAMVGRMIGDHSGTGGSSGVNYLSQTLTKRFFPDVWQSRNHLGAGSY